MVFKNFNSDKSFVKESYAQCGEDLIVRFIFDCLKIENPSYIDIGAHHPYYLSNTYHFYKHGSSGICIEPDPYLFKVIKNRRKDICLNVGIASNEQDEADFYIMSTPTLNTFSKDEAFRYETYGNKIKEIRQIPLININQIVSKYFDKCPNFISIDVEGYDYQILKSFQFEKYRPEVFIIETLTYTEDNSEIKISEIIEYMNNMNYLCYADTYINTIFIDKEIWLNRLKK